MTASSSYKQARLAAIYEAWSGRFRWANYHRLIDALLEFPMTSREISQFLDCKYPWEKIRVLRRGGLRIATHWYTETTELGKRRRVALYVVVGKV